MNCPAAVVSHDDNGDVVIMRGRMRRGISIALALVFSVSGAAPAMAGPSPELANNIRAYLSDQPGAYTVSLRELSSDGVTVGIDDTVQVEPASVIKLFYAWAALRRVDRGSLALSKTMSNGLTWDRCLKLMISISDNKCSADIRQALGNTTLNALFAASGYPNTVIKLTSNGAYKTKRTSAADTTLLLSRLEAGTLLSPVMTTYFHQLLKDQIWRTRINLGVPSGIPVENKGGELWVASGWTQSDAAIIRGPRSTYVLSVYGRNDATKSAIAGISRIVYEYVQGQSVTNPARFDAYQYEATTRVAVRKSPGGAITYRVGQGTFIKAYLSERNWVEIKAYGKTRGWVEFQNLRLREQFRWQ